MPTSLSRKKSAGFVLLEDRFRTLTRGMGLVTDEDIADALGLNRVSVWRVRTGHSYPGDAFVARFLRAAQERSREVRFEDVFNYWTVKEEQ